MKSKTQPFFPWFLFAGIAAIIAAIFVGYEFVERRWLGTADMELIHTFHILRGIVTSLLVAAFVVVYFFKAKGKISGAILGGTLSTSLTEEGSAVRERVLWFVHMRWVAIVLATIAIFVSCRVTTILPSENFRPLMACVVALVAANIIFASTVMRTRNPYRLLIIQVGVDLVVLTLLLHFSGGIENPIYLAYIFHIIIAGILLSKKDAVLVIILASFLFTGLALGESFGLISHSFVGLFPHHHGQHYYHAAYDMLFVISRVLSFLLVLVFTAFFTIHLREQIRGDNANMIQAGKMAAIGELAGSIAHEVNNPVGIMSGKLKLLIEDAKQKGLSGNVVMELKKIDNEAIRISHLTQGLLTFARPSLGKRKPEDLNDIISFTIDLVHDRLKKSRITLESNLATRLPGISVNRDEMKQVILNLVNNATDAMPQGGTLSLQTLLEGKRIKLVVRDTGMGIVADKMNRIFEPFYTTKLAGKGTGLGLSVTHGLVKSHGGTIEVSSKVGAGTTVEVSFPVAG